MTLEEIKNIVDLYKSYHNCKFVEISKIAKELKVGKLVLWKFILDNSYYFELVCQQDINDSSIIKYRYIRNVYLEPMTEDVYLKMLKNMDILNHI